MSHLTMLIGLPGSGKTTYAKKIQEAEPNYIHLSSDQIAHALFREDEPINHQLVFEEMHKQTVQALSAEKNVIYDATNLTSKRRKSFLNRIKKIEATTEGIVFLTPYEQLKRQNQNRTGRERVPDEIIERYIRAFEFPRLDEGLNTITVISESAPSFLNEQTIAAIREPIESNKLTYRKLIELYKVFDETRPLTELEEALPEQVHPVSLQMYELYNEVMEENQRAEDPMLLAYVSLLLDIGKSYTRKGSMAQKSFHGHEHVSMYLAYPILSSLQLPFSFIYDALLLIDEHVTARTVKKGKLRRRIGQQNVERLELLQGKMRGL